MPRFISISKAAVAANVKTKEIQEKINSKELALTCGKIHIDDLIDCYPQARIDQVDMVSLVEKIKEQSFETGAAKQHGEVSIESLKQDLLKYKTNAKYYHEQAYKYDELILHIRENLIDIQSRSPDDHHAQRLIDWIDKRLNEIHRNE